MSQINELFGMDEMMMDFNENVDNLEILKIDDDVVKSDVEKALMLQEAIEIQIVRLEDDVKALQEKAKANKEMLLQNMQKYDIYKLETPKMSIVKVAESERVGVDSAKLKNEYPSIYEEVKKITKVRAYLKITKKGGSK